MELCYQDIFQKEITKLTIIEVLELKFAYRKLYWVISCLSIEETGT